MIHLCYMYRVIIGGNLVRLGKADFFRLPSAIPDTILDCEKYWPQERVNFIICLKVIIVDTKYH